MYFSEISSDNILIDNQEDFHFTYNANSGGGQSFLAGKFRNASGVLTSPAELKDYNVTLQFEINLFDDEHKTIKLVDGVTQYKIKPRGAESAQMKFATDEGMVTPNKAIAAFFMLPPPCGVRKSQNLDESCLTANNYWLQEMPFTVDVIGEKQALLTVRRCVFSGGADTRKSEGQQGEQRYFEFDFNKRIHDVIQLSQRSSSLSPEVAQCINFFASIYKGEHTFSFKECETVTNNIMRHLASKFPEFYPGNGDAFLFICNQIDSFKHFQQPNFTSSKYSRNRIFFGAPGTGKSHQLKREAEQIFAEDNIERVTFYPNYSYAQFVGTYKPIMEGKDIVYKFVPGPFIRSWVKAYKASRNNSDRQEKFLLIIEELNRANAAAVFGDLFQLLDRLEDGSSEYPVATSEDLKNYLADEGITDNETIALPSNMYIWTTMNSADQGVFPLDTAFRRRWDCKYLGIDANEEKIKKNVFKIAGKRYSWNDFRKAINLKLLEFKVNEDKLLGPFYVNPACFKDDKTAAEVIRDKVLMYLYEDAGRQFRYAGLFAGCDINGEITYSAICDAFNERGGEIFGVSPSSDDSTNNEDEEHNAEISAQTKKDYRGRVNRIFADLGMGKTADRTSSEAQARVFKYIAEHYDNPTSQGNAKSAYKYYLKHSTLLDEDDN